jgi:cytochrome c oxidase assembly protein subunit 15
MTRPGVRRPASVERPDAPFGGLRAKARDRWPVSPRLHAYAAWSALVLFSIIVITGAGVRLTGSGLGCHDWPRCSDQSLTPQSGHAFIEFGNRLITTPVALAALACLVFALLRRPYRGDFTWLGVGLVVGVVAQAWLGGLAVLTGLNPGIVMGHFLLSMATIVLTVTLVWRVTREQAAEPQTPARDGRLVAAVRGLVAVGGVVVFLGTSVTASGPFAGGSGTGDDVTRLTIFGLDTFKTMVMVHARLAAAFGVLAVLLWFFARRRGAGADLRRPLTFVCVLVAIAGLIGNLQYHQLDYPAALIWSHVTVATLLWNSLVWAFLAAGRPAPAPVPAAEQQAEPPVPAAV